MNRATLLALMLVIVPAGSAQSINVTGTWQPTNWTIKASLKQEGRQVTGNGGKRDFWFRGAWQGSRLVLVANSFGVNSKGPCRPRGTFILSGKTVARLNAIWHMEDGGRILKGAWIRQSPNAGEQPAYPYATELEACGSLRSYELTFKPDSDQLEGDPPMLAAVATVLKQRPEVKIEVAGHTDSTGDGVANQELSQRRAESVKQALVAKYGADAARIAVSGAGSDQPLGDNATEEGRALNRRVEIILSK